MRTTWMLLIAVVILLGGCTDLATTDPAVFDDPAVGGDDDDSQSTGDDDDVAAEPASDDDDVVAEPVSDDDDSDDPPDDDDTANDPDDDDTADDPDDDDTADSPDDDDTADDPDDDDTADSPDDDDVADIACDPGDLSDLLVDAWVEDGAGNAATIFPVGAEITLVGVLTNLCDVPLGALTTTLCVTEDWNLSAPTGQTWGRACEDVESGFSVPANGRLFDPEYVGALGAGDWSFYYGLDGAGVTVPFTVN